MRQLGGLGIVMSLFRIVERVSRPRVNVEIFVGVRGLNFLYLFKRDDVIGIPVMQDRWAFRLPAKVVVNVAAVKDDSGVHVEAIGRYPSPGTAGAEACDGNFIGVLA